MKREIDDESLRELALLILEAINTIEVRSPVPWLTLLRLVRDLLLFMRNQALEDSIESERLRDPANAEPRILEDSPEVSSMFSMAQSLKIFSTEIPFGMTLDKDLFLDDLEVILDWVSSVINGQSASMSSANRSLHEYEDNTILEERNKLLEENLILKRSLNKRNRRVKILRSKLKSCQQRREK